MTLNTKLMFSSDTDKWDTPQDLIDDLATVFDWDLDVCASRDNVSESYFSETDDALNKTWAKEILLSIPLEIFDFTQSFINAISCDKDFFWYPISAIRTPSAYLSKFQGDNRFVSFYSEIWEHSFQNKESVMRVSVPSPQCAAVILADFLWSYSTDPKRTLKRLDSWLVNHLDKDIEGVVGGSLFSAGSLRDALLEMYTSFSVEQPSVPNYIFNSDVFHKLIIPQIGGFIKHYSKQNICWCNPPYGRDIGKWVDKARLSGANVVMLLPARTDTKWWQGNIRYASQVVFIRGRLKFGDATNSAPFPSAFVVFGEISDVQRAKLASYGWSIDSERQQLEIERELTHEFATKLALCQEELEQYKAAALLSDPDVMRELVDGHGLDIKGVPV